MGLADGWLRLREGAIEVRVRVVPRSSREGFDGFYGDRLRVRLTAMPEGGEANDALIRLLARAARVPPSRGRVVAGARDRSKTVLLEAAEPRKAAETLRGAVIVAVDKRRSHI
jgi:uncharacterized protein YggU (UPF0235/DUF167 family)